VEQSTLGFESLSLRHSKTFSGNGAEKCNNQKQKQKLSEEKAVSGYSRQLTLNQAKSRHL
jgi:hypothetical protein